MGSAASKATMRRRNRSRHELTDSLAATPVLRLDTPGLGPLEAQTKATQLFGFRSALFRSATRPHNPRRPHARRTAAATSPYDRG